MEKVKDSKDYKIFKKKSGRFCIKDSDNKWVNGIEKVKILNAEGFIDVAVPKKVEGPPPSNENSTTEASAADEEKIAEASKKEAPAD